MKMWTSSMTGPPSPTALVLCHGPTLWSPPSGSGGDSSTHAPLQLTSPSSPPAGISVFLRSCLQSLSGLPNVDLAAAAGDTIYHMDCLPRGNVSFTLVNIGRRVCPDLKTTLMLNFLQTSLKQNCMQKTKFCTYSKNWLLFGGFV